jgi:hypothetical protein
VTKTAELPGLGTEATNIQPESRAKSNHTPPRYTFAELLAVLGHVDDYRNEQVSVCWRHRGGTFIPPELKPPRDAPGFVDYLVDRADRAVDVWFGVNPISSSVIKGRGKAKDVTRLVALYADLDVKPGGCPDLDTARGVIDDVAAVMGERPCAVTYSGHGLQPLWPVDPESGERLNNPEAQKLLRRFGRLVKAVADKRGCAVDSVFDLPRVLRVPDTVNVKAPEHPVPTWCEADTGQPLTVEQILTALDDYGVTEIASDAAFTGEVISAPEGWKYGTRDCRYVINMVVPWDKDSDTPKAGRHQWAMDRAVRLAAAHRLGCITEKGLTTSLGHLETSLVHWCQTVGDPRDLHYDEIGSAYRWAMTKVATFTDEQARRELGDHKHKADEREFWESTDTLRHVRDFARARRVGPWAVLGVALARVVTTVPATAQLPPLVGGNASLNLFIGLVAESGHYKGAAERATKDAFALGPIYSTGVGSGEGINHLFGHYDKASDSTVMDRRSILFSVPEIDSLAALKNRNGSTLLSQLRKAWSGEALTFNYVDRNKALVIDEHAYRLTLVAGIQPGRARVLLDDADGGTPQRFVWLPTHDPDAPDVPPLVPEQMDLTGIANGWPEPEDDLKARLTERAGTHVFVLPEVARRLIDDNARAKLRGESTDSALDGHLGLCRIKVAAALTLLHGKREITPQFWDLSGQVMAVSQATRASVERHLSDQIDKTNRARGQAEGIRSVVAEEVREDATIKRVSQNMLRVLEKLDGSASRSDVRRAIARRDSPYFDDALDALVTVGMVEVVDSERGQTLVLTREK